MSISEREQQALDSIEGYLAGSGPELAAKLGMFARLTADEEMPSRERVWRRSYVPPVALADGDVIAERARTRARWVMRLLSRRAAIRLLWLVLTVALLALALTANHGIGKGSCAASRTAACQRLRPPARPEPPPGKEVFMPAGHG